MSASFQQSLCGEFEQSLCQNRIAGAGSPVFPLNKSAYFTISSSTANCQSDTQSLVDLLRIHVDEIMFSLNWGDPTFQYDWTAHPSWNLANGVSDNVVILNNAQFIIPPGFSGNGLVNISYLTSSPETFYVCAMVGYVWFQSQPTSLTKAVFRKGGSASLVVPYWNADNSRIPNPAPDVFELDISTIPTPVDIGGSHPGQMLAMTVPDSIGPFLVTGFGLSKFGEFFQSSL